MPFKVQSSDVLPLKIAIVSDVIYPWVKGGAEKRYYEIYRRLAKNHEVHYFTMQHPGMKKHFEFECINIHAICKAPDTLYVDSRRKILPAIKFSFFLLITLLRYNFDAIDSNEFPHLPNLAIRFYCFFHPSTVFVSTWHEFWSPGYWQDYLGIISGLVGFGLQILSLKSPERIVAVSEHTRNYILRTRIIPAKKIGVVWNGIDPILIKKARKLREPQPNTLIFAGRLIKEKRVDLLIDILKRIGELNPDVKLRIVGDGPERHQLEILSQNMNVEFLGFVEDHLEVLKIIASASVYISMSEREGFNITALEACELGLPTFVKIICFKHPNLHPINSENLDLMLESLPKIPTINEGVSELYSWDNIANQMEDALRL